MSGQVCFQQGLLDTPLLERPPPDRPPPDRPPQDRPRRPSLDHPLPDRPPQDRPEFRSRKNDGHLPNHWAGGWPNCKIATKPWGGRLRTRRISRLNSRPNSRIPRKIRSILQLKHPSIDAQLSMLAASVGVAPLDLVLTGMESLELALPNRTGDPISTQIVDSFKPIKGLLQSLKPSNALNKEDPDLLDP